MIVTLSGISKRHSADAFPALARACRTTFTRQAAHLWRVKRTLQRHLAGRLTDGRAWLIDSLPVHVCRFARASYVRVFAGQAAYGKDHLLRQTFYGFRLRLPAVPAVQRRGAPYKNKSRDPDPVRSAQSRSTRWVIVIVFGQLTERFRVKRVRARDLWHLCHRVIREILGHTVAVWLGVLEGNRPLRFAGLIAE